MNELIEDVINSTNAEGIADLIDCEVGEDGGGKAFLEEFAKNVIKATVAAIRETDYGWITTHGNNEVAEKVADDIESYFGISDE